MVGGRVRRVGKAAHASDAELEINPRARSAVLRVAERVADSKQKNSAERLPLLAGERA